MSDARSVAILGATGSIGSSTLNVISRHPERFRVAVLTAGRRADALNQLAMRWNPDYVVLAGAPDSTTRQGWQGDWRFGSEAMGLAAADPAIPIVVNALVGFAGLESTLAALGAGKRLALANKESLVVGETSFWRRRRPAEAILYRWIVSTARFSSAWAGGPHRKCIG